MRRKKNNKLVYVLVALILFLGLGYAFLQTDLTINGTGKIAASSWNIYFDNVQVTTGSATLQTGDSIPTINSTTLTDITYTITLKEPGDFYEFEVAVVNGGTLDAMIGTITNKLNGNEISTNNALPVYLDYSVAYSDRVAIAPNQLLEAGNSETIKVRLAFRTDIDPEDLPTEGATNTLSFGLNYIQAEDNAVTVPHPIDFSTDSWETIINAVQVGATSAYQVGDTKTVELGNNIGTHTLRIANMATPTECGTEGFSQTACGFVLEFADSITRYVMNNIDTSNGGWNATEIRHYLNDENEPTSIYNSFPEILRNAIIDTTVVSGYACANYSLSMGGCTLVDNNGQNFTSIDKLYLLATHEVWEDDDGDTNDGIDYSDTAYNNTRQLDYYKEIGVTSSHSSGAMKSGWYWWLRSTTRRTVRRFYRTNHIDASPDLSGGNTQAYGVSPAFRLG